MFYAAMTLQLFSLQLQHCRSPVCGLCGCPSVTSQLWAGDFAPFYSHHKLLVVINYCQLRLEPIRRSPAHFEHMGCGSANGIDDDDNPALESVRASHQTACLISNNVLGMRLPCHSQQPLQARASTGFIVAVVLQAVPLLCWTRGRTLMPVET